MEYRSHMVPYDQPEVALVSGSCNFPRFAHRAHLTVATPAPGSDHAVDSECPPD